MTKQRYTLRKTTSKKSSKKNWQWQWQSPKKKGAVVAHWFDCKTAVLGSNPEISPAYSGLLS
jgi:hypothetical protein